MHLIWSWAYVKKLFACTQEIPFLWGKLQDKFSICPNVSINHQNITCFGHRDKIFLYMPNMS